MIDFYLERGQNALVQRELALSDLLIAADRGDEEGVRVWADAYGLWQNTLRYCSRRASQYHELIQEEDW